MITATVEILIRKQGQSHGVMNQMVTNAIAPLKSAPMVLHAQISNFLILNMSVCFPDVSIVNYVCGGDSDGKDKCVFPFVYKGKRFFECTSFDRDAPWCSIKNDGGQDMKEWAYCLCPSEKLLHRSKFLYFYLFI